MKKYNIFYCLSAVLLASASCTDWNDHYQVPTSGAGNETTIWQALCNTPELSNFKEAVFYCGYDVALDGAQMFSVFAPNNSVFTTEKLDSVKNVYKQDKVQGIKDKDNRAITEFIQNHIALYNVTVDEINGSTSRTLNMLNGKNKELTSTTFGGVKLSNFNERHQNGILFSINGLSSYEPNIYEFMATRQDLDSIRSFIYNPNYNVEEFSPSESVPGEIVDGKTHYLDSVTHVRNELFNSWLRAQLTSEDSVYLMVMPNNAIWKEKLEQISKYYVYEKTAQNRDSFSYFFPRWDIISGTVFSEKVNPDDQIQDTAFSTNAVKYKNRYPTYKLSEKVGDEGTSVTYSYEKKFYQYDKPFSVGGIFDDTEEQKVSNGKVYIANKWNFPDERKFLREIVMEAEAAGTIDSVDEKSTAIPIELPLPEQDPAYNKVGGHKLMVIQPLSSGQSKTFLTVDNVLSNIKYDAYIVLNSYGGMPTSIQATVSYYDSEKGSGTEKRVSFAKTGTMMTSGIPYANDTIHIGQYEFPYCTYDLSENSQKVKIILETNVQQAEVTAGLKTKLLFLDCVIFKPRKD